MLSVVVAVILLPVDIQSAEEYEFVLNTQRRVTVSRREEQQEYQSFGTLDAAGNFVPDGRENSNIRMGVAWSGSLPINERRGTVYEYRSGALISGQVDRQINFVPDLGSKVIDFRDYLKDYRPGAPRIWNLPGTVRSKAATGAAAAPPDAVGPPPPPRTAAAPPPVGRAPIPAGDYEYVQVLGWLDEVRRRDGGKEFWSIGTLDAAGNFIPNANYVNLTGPKPARTPATVLINPEGLGEVFEYRSDRLIKGRIDDKLNFVPEVGSKVIDFNDYKYGPGTLPIWNLPGYFQKK